jgi:uncharacterized FAD-dependent dehydrogenase
MYDIIFVGCGPSVLASAVEVLKRNSNTRLLILEKGVDLQTRVKNRQRLKSEKKLNDFDVMCGAGGAGTFSDGKFHFSEALSHYYTKAILPEEEKEYYELYLDLAEKYCLDIGGLDVPYTPKDPSHILPVVEQFAKEDVELYIRRCRHSGNENLPDFVKGFIDYILKKGGQFRFESEVTDLVMEGNICKGVIDGKYTYLGKNVVLGVGRSGATVLIPSLIQKYGFPNTPRDILIGGRVAFPKDIARDYADLMYEFIFSTKTKSNHVLRSFCPCLKGGKVAVENYDDKELGPYSCVNGASDHDYKNQIGNFAFLRITPPLEAGDVFKYGRALALKTFKLGGGKPIVQRISDLIKGVPTTKIEDLEMLKNLEFNYALGSVDSVFGKEVIDDFREAFQKLDSKNLLYGIIEKGVIVWPEIKFGRNMIIETDKAAVKGFKNLYAIGDGAGNSGNIVGAMIAGLICAHNILDVKINDLYEKGLEEKLVIKNY